MRIFKQTLLLQSRTPETPPHANPATPSTADEIIASCLLQHEAQHACDGQYWTRTCRTEVNACNAGIACLQGFIDAYCNGPNPPLGGYYCGILRDELAAQTAAANFHACKCSGGSPATCAWQCKLNYPTLAAYCTSLATLYPD